MQTEYATDIVFANRQTLRPIYEELVRTLSQAVKPDNVAIVSGQTPRSALRW